MPPWTPSSCLPGLLRAARAAGLGRDAAEDAVQATFLVYGRRAHEFDGRARASTWLYGNCFARSEKGAEPWLATPGGKTLTR